MNVQVTWLFSYRRYRFSTLAALANICSHCHINVHLWVKWFWCHKYCYSIKSLKLAHYYAWKFDFLLARNCGWWIPGNELKLKTDEDDFFNCTPNCQFGTLFISTLKRLVEFSNLQTIISNVSYMPYIHSGCSKICHMIYLT